MEGLERLMKGRTVIMITHRLNTIRGADTIIVLHDGVVAEQGRHDDLMARGGIYAGLVPGRGRRRRRLDVIATVHLTGAELAWRAR